ncbi:hypothetical protein [Deinococcus koreensis]|uniref:hypothetical protein n=1 Tax=Deinococcus koreensis TaxID=2054903 RepID=UPI00105713EA|nr:hypothetical protein [Deinococcus koreensis]
MQELNLEPGVDTLSRWIAHYITEQIAIAESATGEEKAKAEERCFDSIMQLWQRRYALPNERSPFKDFASIFETLQRLNPENQKSFYIGWKYHWDNLDDENPSDSGDAKSWLRMALSIDRTARVLIETTLRQAALCVTDSDVQAWLERTPDPSRDFDVQVIMKLVGNLDLDDERSNHSVENDSQESVDSFPDDLSKKAIEKRIQYLEAFLELAASFRSAFQEELGEAT